MKRPYYLVILAFAVSLIAGCGEDERKQTYFKRGTALYQDGNHTKARLEFKNVLQIDPKHPQAWFMIARIEEKERNWKQAFGAYSKAAELDPANLEARTKKGGLLLAGGGNVDEALAEAEAVLAADPQNADALALRGMIRARQGDVGAAVADANSALEQAPDHQAALGLLARIRVDEGKLNEARTLLEKAVTANPENLQLRLFLISVYDTLGDSERALGALEQMVKLQPQELSHRVRLANYMNAHGKADAAEQTLRAAVGANPDEPQAKLALVAFLFTTKGIDSAEQELRRVIDAAPEDYAMRFALAALYGSAGKSGEAETVYREIVVRDGTGPQGLRARGKLAGLFLAANRLEEAEALTAEVLAEYARDADALLVRAAIALQRKDADQAIGDLRGLLGENPDSVSALRLLAQAHLLRGEVALAEDTLEKAIEAAPADQASYFQLADLRAGQGDSDGALLVLDRLLKQVPDNMAALSAVARIQLDKQDMAGLEETVEHLLRLDREHPLGSYLKGILLQREGQAQSGAKQFEEALAKSPTAVEPLVALVRNYLAQDQPEKAESRLRQLLADDPGNILAINLLGDVYFLNERLLDASRQYTKAIRTHPRSPLAYERLALLQARDGDRSSAVETLRSGVAATEHNAVLSLRLGVLLEQEGDYVAAAAVYSEMLERDPKAKAAANNLAMLLVTHQSDDPQNLRRAAELAQRLEETNQAAYLDTAGWVQLKNGNHERALGILEKAAGMGEPGSEFRYHLGMAYFKLGRIEEARTQLSAAVSAKRPFPGIEEAHEVLGGL